MDSSSGVSKDVNNKESVKEACKSHTRINPMEIIKIWGEAESLSRSFEVFSDVRRRVCDTPRTIEDLKSALGGNFRAGGLVDAAEDIVKVP